MAATVSPASKADARHEIEETVQTVLYPGTEVMTDSMFKTCLLQRLQPNVRFLYIVGGLHFKHAGKNVLIPQPSDDLSDPLNWSLMWKMLNMLGMAITTFSWTVGPLAISSQVPYYMAEWDRSLPDIIQLVSHYGLGLRNPTPN